MKINKEKINKWLEELERVETEINEIRQKYDRDEEWSKEDEERFEELIKKQRELTGGAAFGDVFTIPSMVRTIIRILEILLSE